MSEEELQGARRERDISGARVLELEAELKELTERNLGNLKTKDELRDRAEAAEAAVKKLKDILRHYVPSCQEAAPWTPGSGFQCGRIAIYEVSWSDREVYCCAEHLQVTKAHAAQDGPNDRTDEPRVVEVGVFEGVKELLG